MNAQKAKLFRPIFNDKNSWRKFKKAYTSSSLKKRIELSETAGKMKGKQIHHMELPSGK